MGEGDPICNSDWCRVVAKLKEWESQHDSPKREIDSVRCRCACLANMKETIGDPSCPSSVRHARHIACAILRKVNAVSTGDEYTYDTAEEYITDFAQIPSSRRCTIFKKRASSATFSTQKRQKKEQAGCLTSQSGGNGMVYYMGQMEMSVSPLLKAICQSQTAMPSSRDLASRIRTTVHTEMHQELACTNEST